jgi:hypothetical protein
MLKRDLSVAEVSQHLGMTGRHQFTMEKEGKVVRCVSYYRNDVYGCCYLVFVDDRLKSVCTPPPIKMVGRHGPYGIVMHAMIGNPEDQAARVLKAPNLLGDPLKKAMRPAPRPKESTDLGLTAAFLLAGNASGPAAPGPLELEQQRLAKMLDPWQVALGTTREEAERRLGRSRLREEFVPGRELHYYGPPASASPQVFRQDALWLCVLYSDGKAVAVFSRQFVDDEKLDRLQEKTTPQEQQKAR